MEECCLCTVSFGQVLNENCASAEVSVNEIIDHDIIHELSQTSLITSCDLKPVKNAVETFKNFLSKAFASNHFYLLFCEGEGTGKGECPPAPAVPVIQKTTSTSSAEDVSVFGSPLKLQSIVDLSISDGDTSEYLSGCDSDQNISLRGLPINDARKILSRFCRIEKIDQRHSILKSMAILCDQMDLKNTMLIGAAHEEDNGTQRLTTFGVSRSSKTFRLSLLEPLGLPSGIVCHTKHTFQLVERKEDGRRLRIEASWSDDHGGSLLSSLHTARFVLHVAIPFGFGTSPLCGYLNQLKLIMMMDRGLKDGELPTVLSSQPFNALESLQDLFTRVKKGVHEFPSPECGKGKRINLRPSRCWDLTDELWEIFVRCETYQDIVMCLRAIFTVLKKNEFPLFVSPDNETMLARLVQQSSQGLVYFPSLSGPLSLKIVAELGVEKLKKIYTSILSELCSPSCVDGFLSRCLKDSVHKSVSEFDEEHGISETQLDTIKKLHHCTDILCLIDAYTEKLDLKEAASHVLSHYKDNSLSKSHAFIIPLATREASMEVEKMTPSMVRREYKIGHESHVECFFSEPLEGLPFPVIQKHSDDGDNDISMNINELSECYRVKMQEKITILR